MDNLTEIQKVWPRERLEEQCISLGYKIVALEAERDTARAEIKRLKAAALETETITENEYAMLKQQRDTARAHAVEWLNLAPDLAQLLQGWHADGTAWSEWDQSVYDKLLAIQRRQETADSLGSLAVVERKELEELRKDRERLDWIQNYGNRMYGWSAGWTLTSPPCLELRQWTTHTAETTVRRAIDKSRDAAMSGEAAK